MSTRDRILLTILTIAAIVSCIRAPFPSQMYLQHIPTAAGLVLMVVAAKRRILSSSALTCLALFLALHVIGARYIYSYVPYDAWSQRIAGISLTQTFGWRRNHYDRLVHFGFGLLATRPAWEIFTGRFKVPRRFAWYATVEFVLAASLVYELFEWALTMILSPADAGAYNGEQGDIWDAHRDMLAAFIGAMLSVTFWVIRQNQAKD